MIEVSNRQLLTSSAIGLFVLSIMIYLGDYFSYKDSLSLKYLAPYLFTCILSFALLEAALLFKISNFFLLICLSLPLLVWGSSVLIPTTENSFWPLTTIILITFVAIRTTPKISSFSLNKDEATFWIGMFAYFALRALCYLLESIYIENFNLHVLINWGISPLIFFLFTFTLRLQYDGKTTAGLLRTGVAMIFLSTILMLLIEMVSRGQGLGLNFILHGARASYAGGDADITGGHGEPLVLGMSAAFGVIAALYFNNNKLLLLMAIIVLFTVSLRPLLVLGAALATIFAINVRRIRPGRIILVTVATAAAGAHYKNELFAKFLGENSAAGQLDLAGGITVGYNIVYYFRGFQWADILGLKVNPIYQAVGSFLAGGNEGILFINNGFFVLPIVIGVLKVVFFSYVILFAKRNGGAKILFPLIIFLLISCYLDPFQPLYVDSLKMLQLGYVPRESPTYFFIIYLSYLFYLLKFESDAPQIPGKNEILSAVFDQPRN